MKYLYDFVKENGGVIREEIKAFDKENPIIITVKAADVRDKILVFDEKGEKIAETEMELQDYIYEKYDAEIRYCTFCGGIMQKGMTDEDADFYNHADCFPKDMDKRYGKGNWREMPQDENGDLTENCRGGCYEWRDEAGRWLPEPSFYTEWV